MSHAHDSRFVTRLPGLHGLRAVACLMVFAVHFGQIAQLHGSLGPFELSRLLENGNSGVALFFALSGFLLSLPYWYALHLGGPMPETGRFYVRRAARVVPAYFFCLTTLIIVNRLWQEDGWPRDALLHYGFVFNFFDTSIFSINPPFWTVAVEMQFYLLLPLIFSLCWRLRPPMAAIATTSLALAAYVTHWTLASSSTASAPTGAALSPVWGYSLLAHLPHFLFGVLSAWLFSTRKYKPWTPSERTAPARELLFWATLILLVLVLGTPLDELLQIPYGRYNLPFVPALLCLLIVLTPVTATGRLLLDNRPLRAIGTVSYGVYLFHLPVLHVAARLMQRQALSLHEDWFTFGLTSLVTTLAMATASHLILERPVLKLSRK